jgi:predicted nucleic acid-binding protein
VAALVDTNVLVYRYDGRFPKKQAAATHVLREGLADGSLRLAHQSIVEFVAAVTRPLPKVGPLLEPVQAAREVEELLITFDILYPDDEVVLTALRGMATYQLSWFDAHLWAYAERFEIDELLSEDFQNGRRYGAVLVRNPFA